MGQFNGKVALVTGGSRGIGRACAELLAHDGAQVALCARSAEAAGSAAEEIGCGAAGFACDVADPASVDAMVAEIGKTMGPLAILVNNAGVTADGLLARMKEDQWAKVLQTNLTGAFHVCRAAARDMLRQHYGRIVNISSIVGLHGQGGQTNYCAAKAGLIGFTKAYAREVGSRNITVNAVAPGYITTDMTAGLPEEGARRLLEQIPLQRLGTPADVARAVGFLVSDDAAYITGAVLYVDGGLGM